MPLHWSLGCFHMVANLPEWCSQGTNEGDFLRHKLLGKVSIMIKLSYSSFTKKPFVKYVVYSYLCMRTFYFKLLWPFSIVRSRSHSLLSLFIARKTPNIRVCDVTNRSIFGGSPFPTTYSFSFLFSFPGMRLGSLSVGLFWPLFFREHTGVEKDTNEWVGRTYTQAVILEASSSTLRKCIAQRGEWRRMNGVKKARKIVIQFFSLEHLLFGVCKTAS